MDQQPPVGPDEKPEPKGPGIGTYVVAAVVLAAAYVGLQLRKEKPAGVEEPPPLDAPAQRGGAPLAMPASPGPRPADKAAQERGGLGYVNPSADIKGAAGQYGFAGGPGDNTSLYFTGEGGPSSFEGRVIRTDKEWDELWVYVGAHHMPNIDAKREMAIAVMGGEQPAGSAVELFEPATEDGKLVVRYRIAKPDQFKAGTCRPYRVVVLPKSQLPVVFRKSK